MMYNQKNKCVLIIHNIRSAHNVGAMFRTADGAGVDEIFLTGYTPMPPKKDTVYLSQAEKSFKKTALGAEDSVAWKKVVSLPRLLNTLKKEDFEIVALEQYGGSIKYDTYYPRGSVALIVGNEVLGVDKKILDRCDVVVEIPMQGKKNSLNVSVALGIALYQITGTMKEG